MFPSVILFQLKVEYF